MSYPRELRFNGVLRSSPRSLRALAHVHELLRDSYNVHNASVGSARRCRNYGEGRRATLRPSYWGLDRVQGDRSGYGRGAAEWGLDRCGAPPMHVHPFQEEHFEVLSGTVGIQIEDEQRSLGEGEQATVPPGTPHTWYSVDDQEEKARFLFELRPALNTEILLETLYGLATDGNTDR